MILAYKGVQAVESLEEQLDKLPMSFRRTLYIGGFAVKPRKKLTFYERFCSGLQSSTALHNQLAVLQKRTELQSQVIDLFE